MSNVASCGCKINTASYKNGRYRFDIIGYCFAVQSQSKVKIKFNGITYECELTAAPKEKVSIAPTKEGVYIWETSLFVSEVLVNDYENVVVVELEQENCPVCVWHKLVPKNLVIPPVENIKRVPDYP